MHSSFYLFQIDMDFSVAYENSDGLVTGWELSCGKLLEFLINGNVKDKIIKSLLQKLNQTVNESKCKHQIV